MSAIPTSACAIAAAVAARELSAVEVVRATLEAVQRWEPTIGAWELIDTDGALAAAAELDRRLANGGPDALRLLAGVPVGVKDVIDVSGLPTSCGAYPLPPRARLDAHVVSALRRAGAIILGKTVTTAFAFLDPPPTRNPRDPERTPGGSSSGSGAAVGAGTIPLALGTQTAGSAIRPAAFNGAVGFKPTFGRIGRSGIVPLAPSLDHVGIIARSVEDVALAYRALSGHDPDDGASLSDDDDAPTPSGRLVRETAPVFGLPVEAFAMTAPDYADHIRAQADRLRADGAVVRDVSVPLAEMIAVQRVIMWTEAAAVHRDLTHRNPKLPAARLRAVTQVGMAIPGDVYLRADRLRFRFRVQVAQLLQSIDALLLPSVTTTAPSRDTTGDPSLQAPWSLLGLPAISLPTGSDHDGQPYGLQLVGRARQDTALLALAAWVEQRLTAPPPPTLPH